MSINKQIGELYVICKNVINGITSVEDGFDSLSKTITSHRQRSCLIDTLAVLDYEQMSKKNPEITKRFYELCAKCSGHLIPEEILKRNVESLNDKAYELRMVRLKTKLFFKQKKCNMLYEQPEGFVTLFQLIYDSCNKEENVERTLADIYGIIGRYCLDPNRVLVVLMTSFQSKLDKHRYFASLFKEYISAKDAFSCPVAYELNCLQNNADDTDSHNAELSEEERSAKVQNFFKMIAYLVYYGFLDLNVLLSKTSPTSAEMIQEAETTLKKAEADQRKLLTLSLRGPKETAEVEDTSEEKPSYLSNQKLALAVSFLEIGDWDNAKQVFDHMPEYYAASSLEANEAFCNLIDYKIDRLFVSLHPIASLARGAEVREPVVQYVDVKCCESLIDMCTDVFPIVNYCGPSIAHNPLVLTKLIRLCCRLVNDKNGQDEKFSEHLDTLYHLCSSVFLPSLSMLRWNCSLSEDLWLLLSQFPYTLRYRFYSEWKTVHLKQHPLLLARKGEVVGRARHVMKRLSKDTTKQTGRMIGKLSHSYPVVVFDYLLSQIQQFENLIGPVVESLRFVTNLSYDVLAFCIIEHLARPEKQKLKVSHATISSWLQSLATFVGSVFKKYNIELSGVLQFVTNQLKRGTSLDLLVLGEIVKNMSGVETARNLTKDQIETYAGGDILKSEVGHLSQMRNMRRSVHRLKDSLLQDDLAVTLCILIAQQRKVIVFKDGAKVHLKLAGQMLDQCHETFIQFAHFLMANVEIEEYTRRMPLADELMQLYNLDCSSAMFLTRPAYNYKIREKFQELIKAEKAGQQLEDSKKIQYYISACEEIYLPLQNKMKQLSEPDLRPELTTKFFVTFWTLSLYDLFVPTKAYQTAIDGIRKSIEQLESCRELTESKRRKEKERFLQQESKLLQEQQTHLEHVSLVKARLMSETSRWFYSKSPRTSLVSQMVQACLFPRCVFHEADAFYCVKFIETCHLMKTPNFPTLVFFDRIFWDLSSAVACLSEYEASCYGRFICELLELLMSWHSDREKFNQASKPILHSECANHPGFITRIKAVGGSNDHCRDYVDYESFRHVLNKWHYKITRAVLICLTSDSFILIRNILLILMKILPYFPLLHNLMLTIEKRVIDVRDREKDKRQDLHVLAASYWGHLKLRKDHMFAEEDFHSIKERTTDCLELFEVSAIIDDEEFFLKMNDNSSSTNREVKVEDNNSVTSLPNEVKKPPTSKNSSVKNSGQDTSAVSKSSNSSSVKSVATKSDSDKVSEDAGMPTLKNSSADTELVLETAQQSLQPGPAKVPRLEVGESGPVDPAPLPKHRSSNVAKTAAAGASGASTKELTTVRGVHHQQQQQQQQQQATTNRLKHKDAAIEQQQQSSGCSTSVATSGTTRTNITTNASSSSSSGGGGGGGVGGRQGSTKKASLRTADVSSASSTAAETSALSSLNDSSNLGSNCVTPAEKSSRNDSSTAVDSLATKIDGEQQRQQNNAASTFEDSKSKTDRHSAGATAGHSKNSSISPLTVESSSRKVTSGSLSSATQAKSSYHQDDRRNGNKEPEHAGGVHKSRRKGGSVNESGMLDFLFVCLFTSQQRFCLDNKRPKLEKKVTEVCLLFLLRCKQSTLKKSPESKRSSPSSSRRKKNPQRYKEKERTDTYVEFDSTMIDSKKEARKERFAEPGDWRNKDYRYMPSAPVSRMPSFHAGNEPKTMKMVRLSQATSRSVSPRDVYQEKVIHRSNRRR
ncbi:THO complex subunit 2 [Trichinella pseudospiralis]|uniref:THO complex subunit 2 n=1 Tax=Trichinella pseudospiralis TaxID=6337 RepID=A0A0V1ISE9_TRIPS|nr:THO complex subunit 2 [Trichinella pseudospiralis]